MNTHATPPSNAGNTTAGNTTAGNSGTTNKELLLQEINAVTAETAALMKHATDAAGEQTAILREGLEQRYHALQDRFHALQTQMARQAREAARATDQYVHAHPWQSVGVAAAGGLVAGVVIGALIRRS
ncbi:MAG: DUF883 family protein [Burkholderiales bacterium]|nr:DUF883 family protein [Burkholderiales bacterium]